MEPDRTTNGLKLDEICIRLPGANQSRILLSISAVVGPGQVLTVMGPSGSGKSALLAHIGGFLDPAFTVSGRLSIDGHDLEGIPTEKRGVGMLFQDPLLFPHLSVGGNLLFGLAPLIKGSARRRDIAEKALAEVDLGGFFDRDPATLSGGQKARVALQRVMLSAPRFLLLDEPFSALDMNLRQQIRQLVFSRARSAGLPVLLVTHDHADAQAAGGPVVTIGAGGVL